MPQSPALPIAIDVMAFWCRPPATTARIRAAIKAAHDRRAARRDYEKLLGCDDSVLHDIGVTRGNVREALAACR